MTQARAVYVLNAFHRGGAELGLATLLENGFMRGVNLHVLVFARGDEALRRRIASLVGEDQVLEASGRSRISLLALVQGGAKLWRLIRVFRPDVVVLSLKQANIVGRVVLLFFPRIRCVAFEHISRLERGRFRAVYEFLLKLLSIRVDEVWADCRSTLRECQRYYPPYPWRRIRREVAVPLFVASAVWQKSDYRIVGALRLVTAGRLIPRKRFDMIVEALALLKARGIEASCTVYGTGPSDTEIRRRAASAGVSGQLQLLGFVDRWWNAAADHDIFVHASDEEGFCIVAAEAMMVGLPVVATEVGGLREYSTHDVTAMHVPVGRVDALVDAIAALAGDDERRRRLGTLAAKRIAEEFSPGAVRRSYELLSRGLFSARSAGRY